MKYIPKEVKIGPYTVNVTYKENLYITRHATGEYHPQDKKIIIDPSCVPTEQIEVFLHECIEGISSVFNLEMDHHHLSVVAAGLTQCLQDIWVEEVEDVPASKKKLKIDKNLFLEK